MHGQRERERELERRDVMVEREREREGNSGVDRRRDGGTEIKVRDVFKQVMEKRYEGFELTARVSHWRRHIYEVIF